MAVRLLNGLPTAATVVKLTPAIAAHSFSQVVPCEYGTVRPWWFLLDWRYYHGLCVSLLPAAYSRRAVNPDQVHIPRPKYSLVKS